MILTTMMTDRRRDDGRASVYNGRCTDENGLDGREGEAMFICYLPTDFLRPFEIFGLSCGTKNLVIPFAGEGGKFVATAQLLSNLIYFYILRSASFYSSYHHSPKPGFPKHARKALGRAEPTRTSQDSLPKMLNKIHAI